MKFVDKISARISFQDVDSENQLRVYFIGLQGVLAFLSITPFTVMRFLNDELSKAIVDFSIVFSMIAVAVYVVFGTGRRYAKQLAYFFAFLYAFGAVAVFYLGDVYTVMWMFPAAISCYFVLDSKSAVIYTLIILFLNAIASVDKVSLLQFSMIGTVYVVTCVFSFVFSIQVFQDRKNIQNYAFYDVLTGAKTRNLFIRDLQEVINARASSEAIDKKLSLIVFDMDNFKYINKKTGHHIGDRILSHVVGVANGELSLQQNIYRYSGEGFFILAEIEENEAFKLADNIRQKVQNQSSSPGILVTMSLGVVEHLKDESMESLLYRADRALSAAKEGGRNRVSLAPVNDEAG